jgi:hypothetical protein
MTEPVVDEPFDDAEKSVKASHEQAVADLKAKLEKAKSAALQKTGP